MRWRDQRKSTNVEDRRGMGGRGIALGGGGLGIIVLLLAVFLCGADPSGMFRQTPTSEIQPQQGPQGQPKPDDELKKFAQSVLGSTEDVWNDVFRRNNLRYREPKLVLFTGQVSSACGYASAAMGPFYCPGDQKVYLDFAFFPGTSKPVSRSRGFCGSIRDRSRSRSSHSESTRNDEPGNESSGQKQQTTGKPAFSQT